MAISKAEFLSRKPKISVFTDKDGTQVNVRSLNEFTKAKYQLQFIGADGEQNIENMESAVRSLIQLSVVDDNGNLMFSENEKDQIGELDSSFTEQLFQFIRKANDFDLKDGVKDARKN